MLTLLRGFTAKDLLRQDDYFAIFRRGAVMGLAVFDTIDDARSEGWQRAMLEVVAVGVYPRFFAIDVEKMHATNSMAQRYRTVQTIRELASRCEAAVVNVGAVSSTLVVVRPILRVVGFAHVALVRSDREFVTAVEEMHAGKRPGICAAKRE